MTEHEQRIYNRAWNDAVAASAEALRGLDPYAVISESLRQWEVEALQKHAESLVRALKRPEPKETEK